MAKAKPRVLADSNIYVAGMLFPRSFYETLQLAAKGDIRLIICPYIIDETTANLHKWLPDKSYMERFAEFMLAIEPEWIENPSADQLKNYQKLVASAKDLPIAVAAINAKVKYLITNDKVFHQTATIDYLKTKGIRVFTAQQFLQKIMGWQEHELKTIQKREWQDL